ncbi:hypothetical protein P29A0810_121 [Synechococcus phage S-CAM8]|jgi:hypothetical protein|uniref:Uncharacterized protein n=1 Tax=Synechococcus phage S-CAM8 TaxID=754038 RepID=A0A1D8KN86_9CAUD|nr:hypothetical protein P29A0810_121 [Synechococcus phage S-CAM8]
MFVLTDAKSGGIYAVNSKDLSKTVTVFEDRDDAERYVSLLTAEDYKDELEVIEVEKEVIAINCNTYGYNYSIIQKDDLIIPP